MKDTAARLRGVDRRGCFGGIRAVAPGRAGCGVDHPRQRRGGQNPSDTGEGQGRYLDMRPAGGVLR